MPTCFIILPYRLDDPEAKAETEAIPVQVAADIVAVTYENEAESTDKVADATLDSKNSYFSKMKNTFSRVTSKMKTVVIAKRVEAKQAESGGEGDAGEGAEQQSITEKVDQGLDRANTFVAMLSSVADAVTGSSSLIDSLVDVVNRLVRGQSLWFYLVDEVTMQPIKDPTGFYPIEITTTNQPVVGKVTSSELVETFLSCGLKLICTCG